MKLTAEIGGEQSALNLRREGTRIVAEINGRRYELEAREPEARVYLLIAQGHVYECRVESTDAHRHTVDVRVGNHLYQVILTDPKRLPSVQSSGGQAGGRVAVIAPMPGKVVRVLAGIGTRVEAGDGLVIVEAMKMQNEMKSPKAGVVVEVHAEAGATVNAGEVLIVVE